jgi:hypothetical protein
VRTRSTTAGWLVLAALIAACGGGDGGADSTSLTGLGDATGDGDGDGDDGGEGDGDGDGDGDSGFGPAPDVPPPEEEDEGDFRVPKASGPFVYSANAKTHRVAVIDTVSLVIDVVTVGKGPTVVEPIPGQPNGKGAVAVLCEISREVALIRTAGPAKNTVKIVPVSAGTNELAVTPDGAWVVAYHDIDGPEMPDLPTDQEISVLSPDAGETYELTVGAHPRAVEFSPDSSTAYVVTDDGINVVDLTDLSDAGKPDLVPVVMDPGIDPELLEIHVSAPVGHALARIEGEAWVVVTDLASGDQTEIVLPSVPTDLDVAGSGEFAVLVLPHAEGSELAQIPLPPAGPSDFALHGLGAEYVGLVDLAPAGDAMLLYTTVDPWAPQVGPLGDPRKRLTIARDPGSGWGDRVTIFTEVPVTSVGIAPDGRNAILLHDEAPQLNQAAPWPYTLLDLESPFPIKKLQMAQAEPKPILFQPDGVRAALSLRDDGLLVRRVDIVALGSFIVEPLDLGAPPSGLGFVEETEKLFVAQEHPSGRITFVDAKGDTQTATGYELNDAVKD